jgi:hypothetical protein
MLILPIKPTLLTREFKAAMGGKPYFGGDSVGSVDISFYGALVCITIIDTIILTNYTNDAYIYDTPLRRVSSSRSAR